MTYDNIWSFAILTKKNENIFATVVDEVSISGIRIKNFFFFTPSCSTGQRTSKNLYFINKKTLLKVGNYICWESELDLYNMT